MAMSRDVGTANLSLTSISTASPAYDDQSRNGRSDSPSPYRTEGSGSSTPRASFPSRATVDEADTISLASIATVLPSYESHDVDSRSESLSLSYETESWASSTRTALSAAQVVSREADTVSVTTISTVPSAFKTPWPDRGSDSPISSLKHGDCTTPRACSPDQNSLPPAKEPVAGDGSGAGPSEQRLRTSRFERWKMQALLPNAQLRRYVERRWPKFDPTDLSPDAEDKLCINHPYDPLSDQHPFHQHRRRHEKVRAIIKDPLKVKMIEPYLLAFTYLQALCMLDVELLELLKATRVKPTDVEPLLLGRYPVSLMNFSHHCQETWSPKPAEWLLEHGVSANKRRALELTDAAFEWASECGGSYDDIMRGLHIYRRQPSPVTFACSRPYSGGAWDYNDYVTALLEHGANPDDLPRPHFDNRNIRVILPGGALVAYECTEEEAEEMRAWNRDLCS